MTTGPSPEEQAARERLREAIIEVDRLFSERKGEPRGPNEMLTHWLVVASYHQTGDTPDEDATQITTLRAPMAMWMELGMLETAVEYARHDLYPDMDEDD